MRQQRTWALIGGLVYGVVGAARLLLAPVEQWRFRDDAVITLSHAIGWVQNGTPSVSASGETVEGFSAPLQFFLASLFYRLGGSGYQIFLDCQVIVGVIVLGYLLNRTMQDGLPSVRSQSDRLRVLAGVGITAAVGLLAWPAVGWLASGMENSLTLPLLAAVLAGYSRLPEARGWFLGLVIGLAGVSRTDFMIVLIPALAGVAYLSLRRFVDWVVFFRVVTVSAGIWLTIHVWRYLTFGSLIPNTAVVQNKTLHWQYALAAVVALLAAAGFCWWCRERPRMAWVMLPTGAVLITLAFVAPPQVIVPVAFSGFAIIAGMLWVLDRGTPYLWLGYLVVTPIPLLQVALFGPARLDPNRIAAMALPLAALSAGILLVVLLNSSQRPKGPQLLLLISVGLLGIAASVVASLQITSSQDLCCSISESSIILRQVEVSDLELQIPRPILATPDLGKESFPKETVTTDLGLLGDGLMSQMTQLAPDRVPSLLQRVTTPDLVGTQFSWACYYRPWLTSSFFVTNYAIVEQLGRVLPEFQDCPNGGKWSLYQRNLDSAGYAEERNLARTLAESPNDAGRAVRAALHTCRSQSQRNALDCQWVRRAVQRSAPELRAADTYDSVVGAFDELSPVPEIDRLLLTTPPGWDVRAARLLIPYLND
ncbi:MAG: hypothetical protein WCP28_02560 [Actinomycetes bacterium]